jgi:hypothetical protein
VAITRRTTGAGEVRYEVRLRGPDGQERSRTFRTRKAAETYARELLAQRDRGGWVDPRAGRITLGEWVGEWSATLVNLRPSSRRIYLDNLRLHVLPELGSVPLNKAGQGDAAGVARTAVGRPAEPRNGSSGVPGAAQDPGLGGRERHPRAQARRKSSLESDQALASSTQWDPMNYRWVGPVRRATVGSILATGGGPRERSR